MEQEWTARTAGGLLRNTGPGWLAAERQQCGRAPPCSCRLPLPALPLCSPGCTECPSQTSGPPRRAAQEQPCRSLRRWALPRPPPAPQRWPQPPRPCLHQLQMYKRPKSLLACDRFELAIDSIRANSSLFLPFSTSNTNTLRDCVSPSLVPKELLCGQFKTLSATWHRRPSTAPNSATKSTARRYHKAWTLRTIFWLSRVAQRSGQGAEKCGFPCDCSPPNPSGHLTLILRPTGNLCTSRGQCGPWALGRRPSYTRPTAPGWGWLCSDNRRFWDRCKEGSRAAEVSA